MAALSSSASFGASSVGDFTGHADIGSAAIAGDATYDPATQSYVFRAGGDDIWSKRDQFHFAWKQMRGDFLIRTRAEFLAPGVHPKRKMGIMARASLDADAAYVDGAAHGIGTTDLQFRRTTGAKTEEIFMNLDQADVLQLERRGKVFILSAARYGEPFHSRQIDDVDLGDEVYVGLFLCAHSTVAAETALFRDVRLVTPAAPDFRPYHDYIGSRLEVLNVFTGRLLSLHTSEEPFEAPNWTQDGTHLIYNVSGSGPHKGLLRRFDLGSNQPLPLDTGFATHNNNDHVLSFDGKLLGVSNQGPETGRKSAVFVLPADGGTPRQLTPLTPSYLHGFSPDGKYIVYTGGRRAPGATTDQFDIYRMLVTGGEEQRLTEPKAHCDGSEYSPDGKYIYYTSTQTGKMQIWRMQPDGSQPEQVTHDEYNNWFPHISPDGKWIAMVSYRSDIDPAEHPYYKHVYLRLMPITGGEPKVIAYVYGGQGTMNVPSWSPDSRRIAFVSNSKF